MLGRVLDCLYVYAPAVVYTLKMLNNQGKKEKLICGSLLLASLYWSVMYVLQQPWPNLNDLAMLIFDKPTQALMHYWKEE